MKNSEYEAIADPQRARYRMGDFLRSWRKYGRQIAESCNVADQESFKTYTIGAVGQFLDQILYMQRPDSDLAKQYNKMMAVLESEAERMGGRKK